MQPKVSVVIPTYNRRESLRRCLDSLARQEDAPSFEVIVVDDGSTDGTRETLAGYHPPYDMSTITSEHAGPAEARNTGVAQAQGQHVLFVDDDVEADPRLLSIHAAAHREKADVVIIGAMAPPRGERIPSWARWEQEVLDKQYRAMVDGRWKPTPRQFYTANASLSRRHFIASGGFNPEFRRAEDVELAYRLRDQGLRFVFRSDAVVTHYARRSLRAWWRVPYQYGIYDVRMSRNEKRRFILNLVAREFPRRHALSRWLTRVVAGRGLLTRAAAASAVGAAVAAGSAGLFPVARGAYSLAFNLLYFQGLCDELGSTAVFRWLLADGTMEPAPGATRQAG